MYLSMGWKILTALHDVKIILLFYILIILHLSSIHYSTKQDINITRNKLQIRPMINSISNFLYVNNKNILDQITKERL